jgi:hypothetical protein
MGVESTEFAQHVFHEKYTVVDVIAAVNRNDF